MIEGIGDMLGGIAYGHPGPVFDISGVFFRILLPSKKTGKPDAAVDDVVRDVVNDIVKQRLSEELILLTQKGFIHRQEIEKIFNISLATAQKNLALLRQYNLIIFEGPRRPGGMS